MDYYILDRFMSRKGKIQLSHLKETLLQLKNEARKERGDEINENYSFHDGQVNAYCICLDLIEKFEKQLGGK